MVAHRGVTIVVEIDSKKLKGLRTFLKSIVDQNVETNPFVPFKKIDTAHYARWVILDSEPDAYGNMLPAQLLYSASVDGSIKNHLKQLISIGNVGVKSIYECCKGYPSTGSNLDILNFLKKHHITSTFYSGYDGVSLSRIKREDDLRTLIQDYLDLNSIKLSQMTYSEVRAKIQEHVKSNEGFSWALKREQFSFSGFIGTYFKLIRLSAIGFFLIIGLFVYLIHTLTFIEIAPILVKLSEISVIILLTILIFLALLLILMRLDEKKPSIYLNPVSDKDIMKKQQKETLLVQTQYTACENMKPRWIRTVWQTTILKVVIQIVPVMFIPTVHMARWFQINNRKQVVFVSNFDGDSESYLHGFIDLKSIARSMNLMYGSSIGFPRTKWLIGKGADDRQGYMKLTRAAQAETNVWYSAVKHLTVENVKNNKEIRKWLFGRISVKKLKEWCQRL